MKPVLRVLIVEDHDPQLQTYKKIVEDLGHQVLTARDGGEAGILLVESEVKIDAVICDVQMHPRDGIYFLQYIYRSRKKLPVLLHSSESEYRFRGTADTMNLAVDIKEVFDFAEFHKKDLPYKYIGEFLKRLAGEIS